MALRPLGDRVIVRPDQAEEQTASGIILAPQAQERPQRGTVIAVGDGTFSAEHQVWTPTSVKVGDRVVYSKFGGTEVDEVLVLNDRDILAVDES